MCSPWVRKKKVFLYMCLVLAITIHATKLQQNLLKSLCDNNFALWIMVQKLYIRQVPDCNADGRLPMCSLHPSRCDCDIAIMLVVFFKPSNTENSYFDVESSLDHQIPLWNGTWVALVLLTKSYLSLQCGQLRVSPIPFNALFIGFMCFSGFYGSYRQ